MASGSPSMDKSAIIEIYRSLLDELQELDEKCPFSSVNSDFYRTALKDVSTRIESHLSEISS